MEIGTWSEQIARVPMPSLRWRFRRHATLLTAAVAFLLVAIVTPNRCLPAADHVALQTPGTCRRNDDPCTVCRGIAAIRVLDSEELLQGQREMFIVHAGQVYRLLRTRNDKLILQK